MSPRTGAAVVQESTWTFLTNHAHVLLCLAMDPEVRMREVADKVGITERAVQKIVADLEESGYLTRVRAGRRNRYQVHPHLPLRHPIESHQCVDALLALVLEPDELDAVFSASGARSAPAQATRPRTRAPPRR
ncbi:helix-turn-helix transcriptional regulator [Hyalangium gracile]|uniref:helix-turn-helix transcriptional regulator n=1 Tax=Hyalangium gracile TaxID=394092 RepID=UPI001CCF3D51|nr:winged helix-turn-helix domain-containing protein [Hyalangium gracile]